MNTSAFFASPPLISSSRTSLNAFSTPKFSPKRIRCMQDSNVNLSKSKPNHVSFATASVEAPLETTTRTTTTSAEDKLCLLVSEFRSLTEPIDRVKRLLNYAMELAPLDDSARVPENRVPGCTTQVWLDVKMDELGRMRFRADSDSEISKGFCSCLIWILDGARPEEVLGVRGEDLVEMNVGVHGKAQSRVNTWQNVLMSMQKRTMALVVDADVAHGGGDRTASPQHQRDILFDYVNGGRSYMESSKARDDYSISPLPLYYDFTI
ncbi:unnamed protein product [Eruca vesicaria subsp. sativa]|uniref:Fe-S metabolism associated domain-containing protein n=1 Tax=Eruca vesicaria subsp. sativa TaxID=29727 RepID=A0ABC8LH16_ERUVS|nr:unnamed protein product [Eruca vesicaria subsp. sativa]